MRWILISALALAGCGTAPPRDATQEKWYGRGVEDLAAMNRQAEENFKAGRGDAAAALIQKGEPLMNRLLSVPHPTLAAEQAASDLEDLYGRMLLSNRHYGWAQMMFQKNLSRWKHWEPQTDDTARRLKQARDEIAQCTQMMEQ